MESILKRMILTQQMLLKSKMGWIIMYANILT